MRVKVNFLKTVFALMMVLMVLNVCAANTNAGEEVGLEIWAAIGLVVSEVASLVSKKYTGIVQGLFLVVKSIFAGKKK